MLFLWRNLVKARKRQRLLVKVTNKLGSNSPYLLPYISLRVSTENLLGHQDHIPWLIIFFVLLFYFFFTAIAYTIRVITGDQSDAGTQAQAHIVLIGSEAATEKIPLVLIQREGFSPGLTETFSVEAADVGEVKKVELSHNGYGADSGWFVKEVEVDVPTSGKKYFFPCNRWLSQNKEDGKVIRVLSASDDQLVTYKPRKFIDMWITRYTAISNKVVG